MPQSSFNKSWHKWQVFMQRAYEQRVITFFIYVSDFITLFLLYFNRSWRTSARSTKFSLQRKMSKVFCLAANGKETHVNMMKFTIYTRFGPNRFPFDGFVCEVSRILNNEQSQNTFFLCAHSTELHINNCERKTLCLLCVWLGTWKITIKAFKFLRFMLDSFNFYRWIVQQIKYTVTVNAFDRTRRFKWLVVIRFPKNFQD